MSEYYIGIDNGLDGAIVMLNADGSIHHKGIMPTIKIGKGRIIDIHQVREIVTRPYTTVILEEAQKHSPGKLALCSTWFTYGHLLALLTLDRMPYEIVRPKQWQKAFWAMPKMAKGKKFDTKAAALSAASRIWPSEDWTKSDRARKPHDGMVDAALIAEYGRRKLK